MKKKAKASTLKELTVLQVSMEAVCKEILVHKDRQSHIQRVT